MTREELDRKLKKMEEREKVLTVGVIIGLSVLVIGILIGMKLGQSRHSGYSDGDSSDSMNFRDR